MLMLLADASLGCCWKFEARITKMNLGFLLVFVYNFDAAVLFYGAFGHYLYNNNANSSSREPLIQDEMLLVDVATSPKAENLTLLRQNI
jgi:iron complex outermembrane receptor protein